jgi:NAD-dependent dihydropyrimidine dehydrogenase PreA subunit
MIELVSAPACIGCDKCVDVCPTDVFDRMPSGVPVIARQSDCQTCFMCELYCRADAIYVAPDCDRRVAITPEEAVVSGRLGQYRKHSGWDEWAGQFSNEQWLMETVFRRAGEAARAAETDDTRTA